MKKTSILFLFFYAACSSVDAQIKDTCQETGSIIHFEPNKAYGIWGWTIALKNDTILADDLSGGIFGHDFSKPMKIRVTVGKRIMTNSGEPTRYHEILCARKDE